MRRLRSYPVPKTAQRRRAGTVFEDDARMAVGLYAKVMLGGGEGSLLRSLDQPKLRAGARTSIGGGCVIVPVVTTESGLTSRILPW